MQQSGLNTWEGPELATKSQRKEKKRREDELA